MLKLFVSFYLLLLAAYLVDSQVIDPIMISTYQDALDEDLARDHRGTFILLETLHPSLSVTQWEQLLEKISNESNLPIETRPIAQWPLPEEALKALYKGETWVEDWEEDLVYRLIEGNIVARIGPMGTIESAMDVEGLDQFFLFVALGLFTLLGAGWLQYRLQKLEQATIQFSNGQLGFRAPTGYLSVGRINQAFNSMAERLERLFLSHRHLTNAVSHELRSPIMRIRFQLEMLSDAKDDEARQPHLIGISDDIDDMDTLVDEMLSYARMERTEPLLQLDNINLHSWLKEQCKHLACEVATSIELELSPEPIQVEADPVLMARLFRNLICNAERFAQHRIVVGIASDNQSCRLWIDDDGPGIPESEREGLFEPFARLEESRSKKHGGFGLGLAIAAQIARCHRGTLDIQTSAYGGSRMLLTWPITTALDTSTT